MKALQFISFATGMAFVLAAPAWANPGNPVPGEEHVEAQVNIITAGVESLVYYEQTPPYDSSTTATPFVMTRGTSNAVHGGPSNPLAGGLLLPSTLDSSNSLTTANTPLDMLGATAHQSWDRKSFAYAMGNGPSFSVGVAVGGWGQQAYALYRYTFEHTNQSGHAEALSSVAMHVDRGRLFLLVPQRAEHQDFSITDLQFSFNYGFSVTVSPDGASSGGSGRSFVQIVKTGLTVGGDLNLPAGYHELGDGIAGQQIPAQTLTVPAFDLQPGQRVAVDVSIRVDAYIDGSGIAPPIMYAVAGDPVSLTAGTATPNFQLTYAPAAQVPEPMTWLLLLAGGGVLGLRRVFSLLKETT